MEKENKPTCASCKEYFNGECIGKSETCEFYRFKPPMTRRKYEEWPGDNYAICPYK